jgi:hypothetical protein
MIGTVSMNQASRILARSLLQQGGLSKDSVEGLISRETIACKAWKKAVGKRLAARTNAVKLVRDRLVVEVEDEIWRSNLWSLRYQILKNLEKCLGPEIVGDLEFRVMPPRREPQRAAPVLATAADLLLDDAAGIEDPGLRRNYRRARDRESRLARESALEKTA